jgi:hypothetical protein
MKDHITIDNYEAFYLDYLEGNLGGEDLAAFEAFLDAHQELRMDDHFDMPAIEPEEAMDGFSKLLLKKHVPVTELSAENFDFFLISYTEGLFDEKEKAYFLSWVSENPEFAGELSMAARAVLQADMALVYTEKEALHQSKTRVLPMWWAMGAVAAGLAILITLNIGGKIAAPDTTEVAQQVGEMVEEQIAGNSSGEYQNDAANDSASEADPYDVPSTSPATRASAQDAGPKAQPSAGGAQGTVVVPTLDPKEAGVQSPSADPVILQSGTPNSNAGQQAPARTEASASNMVNPIKPVTKTLSEKLDTPIDFKKGKATKEKRGGFYVKIGKLEVSHTTASLH